MAWGWERKCPWSYVKSMAAKRFCKNLIECVFFFTRQLQIIIGAHARTAYRACCSDVGYIGVDHKTITLGSLQRTN